MNEQKIKLKPTGIYKESLKSYYTVQYNDEEYFLKMWKFQVDRSGIPESIDCIIKEDADGGVIITQDLMTIVNELYKVGGIYRFRVKRKYKDYYSVIESNGLIFRLTEFGDARLFEGQSISAEVISISPSNTCLRLKSDAPDATIPFKTFNEISRMAEIEEESLQYVEKMLAHPSFKEVRQLYDSQDGKWVLEAVLRLDDVIIGCEDMTPEESLNMVSAFNKMCHYIIEESDMLKCLKIDERKQWLQCLTNTACHAEDYRDAFSRLKDGTEREYVNRQLTNLKESENLFQPERKFRCMMVIFGMREQLMIEMMPRIFEIILGGNKEHWRAEPFRTAFVDMLELFITEYRERAMRNSATGLIPKLITAIAIQQLLSNSGDNIDRRLNHTTFLRLLACMDRYASEGILEDAFQSLFISYNPELKYGWKDLEMLESLYMRMAYTQVHPNARKMKRHVYRADDVELIIDMGRVLIQSTSGRPKSVLPQALLPWHRLDIRANVPLAVKDKKRDDLAHLDMLWKDIRDALFVPSRMGVHDIKQLPQVGDIVVVRIVDVSDDFTSFYCEIVDNELQGTGWMDLNEMVKYIKGSPNILDFFKDQRGRGMLLEVEVKREADANGEFEFTMLHLIQDFFESTHNVGDIIRCNIRKIGQDRKHYVAVSSFGSSCRVLFNPETGLNLQSGDIVEAQIKYTNEYGQFVCDYISGSDRSFSISGAFRILLRDISVPDVDAEDEETNTEEVEEMTRVDVYEIICILDRLAVLSETNNNAYGYLSLAAILSEMIGDDSSVDYYEKRKSLMKIFYNYEKYGSIDGDVLQHLVQSIGDELVASDYLMNESLTKIRILDSLKHKDNVDKLYSIRSNTHNSSIRNAADLAISLLLTSRFEIPNVQRQLEDRICKELGVKVRTSKLKDYGFETQTLEFKSSIIYPADNHMQPAPDVQGAVIMQTICGFLNSENGGVLFLGVNKNGAACGVDEDMRYLHADEDAYGRYVHGMINRELGQIANQCCLDCVWESDGGYRVYKMNIKPSPELILFRGQYWIRQDTEKRPLSSAKIDTYRQMHEAAYRKLNS